MYIHFAKLPRKMDTENTLVIGGASMLVLGNKDHYDDEGHFSYSSSDLCLSTGSRLTQLSPLDNRLYKSWEMKPLMDSGEMFFIERLFIRIDTGNYIPYRVRISDRDGGARTYVLYRNLEEIRKILYKESTVCLDPRVSAMEEYGYTQECNSWVPFIDFTEFLVNDSVIANKIGYRDRDRSGLERHIDRAIDNLRKARHETSVSIFRDIRESLVPQREDFPMAYLSEDVTSYTTKEIRARYRCDNFYWDKIDPIEWKELPNVISPQLGFRKTISLMEDFIFTDVNIDIEVEHRNHIMGIYPAVVIDRYQDLRRKPIIETTPDDYRQLIEVFVDEVHRYIYTQQHRELQHHLDGMFLIKFIKTPIEEGLLLVYPYGSQHSSEPLFGIYVDFAAEALCDLNVNWQ